MKERDMIQNKNTFSKKKNTRYKRYLCKTGDPTSIEDFNRQLQLKIQQKKLGEALQYFKLLSRLPFKPNVYTYTMILNAYVRCSEIDKAQEFYKQHFSSYLSPSIVASTTLMKGFCQNLMIIEAVNLFITALNFRVENCNSPSNTDEAYSNQNIDQSDILKKTLCSENSYNKKHNKIFINTRFINMFLRLCLRSGNLFVFLLSCQIINAIYSDLLELVSLSMLLKLLLSCNYTGEAYKVLKFAEQFYNPGITSGTEAFANFGFSESALILQLFSEMYINIAQSYCINRKLSKAIPLLERGRAFSNQAVYFLGNDTNKKTEFLRHQLCDLRTFSQNLLTLASKPGNSPQSLKDHLCDIASKTFYICMDNSYCSLRQIAIVFSNYWDPVSNRLKIDHVAAGNSSERQVCFAQLLSSIWEKVYRKLKHKELSNQDIQCLYSDILKSSSENQNILSSKNDNTLLFDNSYIFGLPKLSDSQYDISCIDRLQLNGIRNSCPEIKQYNLEIGSGTGSWITSQADKFRDICWVAMELRFDRVSEIIKFSILQKLRNICIIGGDAQKIIQIFEDSLFTQIFINFPEPPPYLDHKHHLLSVSFFKILYRVLKIHGEILIISDQVNYLISLYQLVSTSLSTQFSFKRCANFNSVVMEGVPENYDDTSSSYFERLWKKKCSYIRLTKI